LNLLRKPIVHIASLLPLLLLILDWWNGSLTANPIQYLTLKTGKTALILLSIELSITPIVYLTGKKFIRQFKKMLGLYAAFYAFLHFSVFVFLDYFFDWELIKDAIVEKPYVLVGFSALLILATLTATSTKGWKLRLKRNWKRLHRLVYVAGILVIFHYTWLVKADIREPLVYGAFMAVFLIIRIPFIRDRLIKARESRISQQVQS